MDKYGLGEVCSVDCAAARQSAAIRHVNDISLDADHVSSYVMHDTARLNLGMDNERGTHSVEKSGDKVYLKIGKLMETNFEHKGPRKMIGGGGGCIFSTIAAKWTLLVFTFLNRNWGGGLGSFHVVRCRLFVRNFGAYWGSHVVCVNKTIRGRDPRTRLDRCDRVVCFWREYHLL
jgi:hypothetical protein